MSRLTPEQMVAIGMTTEEVRLIKTPVSKMPKGMALQVLKVLDKLNALEDKHDTEYRELQERSIAEGVDRDRDRVIADDTAIAISA